MFTIIDARFPEDVETVRALFLEYARSLDFDLCFQDFDAELATLPGEYAAPRGRVLVALAARQPAGCVAVRPFSADACEMKRMYVAPGYRGQGVGRALAERIVMLARERGYRRMLLDTVPAMTAAISLYRDLGFREISPYRVNPLPGALYFELELSGPPAAAHPE